MAEQEYEYHMGDSVRLLGTEYTGTIEAIYSRDEESDETGYAVRMSDETVRAGYDPIEVVSHKQLKPVGRQDDGTMATH